jgi:hypothetical protein
MTIRNKRTTVYIAYCLIIVALIAMVSLIYNPHHPNHKQPVIHRTITSTQQNPAGKSTTTAGTTHITVTGSAKGTAASTTSTKLNNTGPGNVVGLFALVSVLGAWLYRRKLIRSVIR